MKIRLKRLRLRVAILWWRLMAEKCLMEKRALEWVMRLLWPEEAKRT